MADRAPSTIQPPDDALDEDEPTTRKRRQSGPRAARTTTAKKIEDNIVNQVVGIGMMVGQADRVSGFILITGAPQFAASWAEVARVNPQVRAVLEKWFTGSVYMNAAMATAMIGMPLLTHYGMMPRAWFNPTAAQTQMIEEQAENMTLEEMLVAYEQLKQQMASMSASAMATAAAASNGGLG